MPKIIVPICNTCNKPHFWRTRVEERCICDCSWDWHEWEIEEEVIVDMDVLPPKP